MNANDLVARVRERTASLRTVQNRAGNDVASLVVRKWSYVGLYPLRMFDASVWNWLRTAFVGAIVSLFFHLFAMRFVATDVNSFLAMESLIAMLAVVFLRWKEPNLDSSRVPLLAHFSSLPWSNHRLVFHFLVGCISRSGVAFGYWLVSGLGLYRLLNSSTQVSFAIPILVSAAIYLSIVVCMVFLNTVDGGTPRFAISLTTVLVPIVWPNAILWMGFNGVRVELLLLTSILGIFVTAYMGVISVLRLHARLPIVEYLVCSSQGSWAVPMSRKETHVNLSRWHDRQKEQAIAQFLSETRMDVFVTAALIPGFESATARQSLVSRFGYCQSYWIAQGWPLGLVRRILSDRQMQIVALVDTLKNQSTFPLRWSKFIRLQILYLVLIAVGAFVLPSWGILQALLPMIALSPIFRYWAKLHGHVPISSVRSLPYSSRELVWGLIKRGWMESLCVWPISAAALIFSVYVTGNLGGEFIVRTLVVATILVIAAQMPLVAFCLHDQTRQSTFNFKTLHFSVAFFALVGSAVLAGIFLAAGDPLAAISGAMVLIASSYGLVSLSIAVYRSSQVDCL